MKRSHYRSGLRLLSLCGLLGLACLLLACGKTDDPGTPPSPSQHLQEILNNPHVPQSIKDAAQKQAQGQMTSGAQKAPAGSATAGR